MSTPTHAKAFNSPLRHYFCFSGPRSCLKGENCICRLHTWQNYAARRLKSMHASEN